MRPATAGGTGRQLSRFGEGGDNRLLKHMWSHEEWL
jgi:hypothetical protein